MGLHHAWFVYKKMLRFRAEKLCAFFFFFFFLHMLYTVGNVSCYSPVHWLSFSF